MTTSHKCFNSSKVVYWCLFFDHGWWASSHPSPRYLIKMMTLHHGWGWQPTQTASCIHIIRIQSVWAHWYAVHRHMAVASNIYTHTTWLIFLGSGSLMELKWCHYIMVEAKKPYHTTSCIYIGHIQCVWACWHDVHGYMTVASNSYTHTTWGSDFEVWVTCGFKMMSFHHGWSLRPPQTDSCIHIRHIQGVWAHSYAVHWHMAVASNSYTQTTWDVLFFWTLLFSDSTYQKKDQRPYFFGTIPMPS